MILDAFAEASVFLFSTRALRRRRLRPNQESAGVLLKPSAYLSLSGQRRGGIGKAKEGIDADLSLIVVDDLSLPVGATRA